ncbi:MAG TPA: DUF3631 domain-containing protein [Streptosporangiaceae bacterium]|nr:DUF3631 domain-containing protein [Streptosporangiaceae bacterium]
MMTDQEGILHDRLARGEAVPGGPGACARDGCAHLTLWHGEHGRYRKRPCRQCGCPSYVPQPEGAAILGQLHAILTRYVILPSAEATTAVALWTAATHAQPAWQHAPRLVIRAPEKRCGKSRLLDIVEGTCHAPLITVNASPAAVYRAIGGEVTPTLLVDEADTIFGGKNADANEDLRGLLNAGHQRNRPAIRWDAGTRSLETIPTFAMAALAGIGAMPDTIEDRAVVIRMRRRAPGETVAPFRHRRDRPALTALAAQLARWLGAHLAELERAEPAMPLEDRAADTWEPLVAVADLAGGPWPGLARHAAVVLTTDRDAAASVSDRIRLLADCRTAFGDAEALPTITLIARLRSDPEAPWSDHGPDGISARRLAVLLADYDIRSEIIRFGEPIGRVRGYRRGDFSDAWARYCPRPSGGIRDNRDTHDNPSSAASRHPARHGSIRDARQSVPGVTCENTDVTDVTDTPRLGVINGGAA